VQHILSRCERSSIAQLRLHFGGIAGHQSQVRDDAVFSDDQSGVVEPVCACCGRLQDRESQTPVNKAAKRDEFYRLLGQLHDGAFDARCSARACINPTISEPP
jgi:hypothetical protein